MLDPSGNIPTILVAFGATGDLMRDKVVRALFHLHTNGEILTMFRIVGFSRRPRGDAEFREHIKSIVSVHATELFDPAKIESFIEMISFQRGDFDEKTSY